MTGCDKNAIFLLPANVVKRPPSKALRKINRSAATPSVFSNLICGIKDIVKAPQKQHSNRQSLFELANEPNESAQVRSVTPDPTDRSDGRMSSSKFPSSISSPNLAKQDSGSSSTASSLSRVPNDLINFSEDYARIVEERERRMDERRMSNSRGSSGSISTNGENRTPKSKKRTLQLPTAPNREIKPSTILRLEDRDLVVIDKQDIKEAVSNESQVIIVDPPALPSTPSENSEHVELSALLGGQWPDAAGGAATLLNAEKKSGSISSSTGNAWKTLERNKSPNFASHLHSSKPRRSDGYENGYDKNFHKKSEY